jgi:hypothetical protein
MDYDATERQSRVLQQHNMYEFLKALKYIYELSMKILQEICITQKLTPDTLNNGYISPVAVRSVTPFRAD